MFDFFRFKFTFTYIFRLLFTFYLSVETFNPNSNLLRDFRKQWYVSDNKQHTISSFQDNRSY